MTRWTLQFTALVLTIALLPTSPRLFGQDGNSYFMSDELDSAIHADEQAFPTSALTGTVLAQKGEKNGKECVPPVYPLRFQVGLSYFDIPMIESKVGVTYGFDGVRPLIGNHGAYGAIRFNHIAGGTQILGSVGSYKPADASSDARLDRVGYAGFFDMFTDTRGRVFLSQFRLQVGYALSDDWAVGVRYSNQVHEDANGFVRIRGNQIGPFSVTETVTAFVSGYVNNNLVTLAGGYNDERDSVIAQLSVRHPVNERLYTFIDAYYEDEGHWAGVVGIEIRFRPTDCYGRRGATAGCGVRNMASPWDDPTIAQAFNYGEGRFWMNDVDVPEDMPAEEEMGPIDPPEKE